MTSQFLSHKNKVHRHTTDVQHANKANLGFRVTVLHMQIIRSKGELFKKSYECELVLVNQILLFFHQEIYWPFTAVTQ